MKCHGVANAALCHQCHKGARQLECSVGELSVEGQDGDLLSPHQTPNPLIFILRINHRLLLTKCLCKARGPGLPGPRDVLERLTTIGGPPPPLDPLPPRTTPLLSF